MQKQDDNVQVPRFASESSPDRRESVAAVLRRAREKHGQDVRSVAQVLRIRQAYLEALEAGAFDKLPGSAYAIGFLRTYADYLGLNADNIIDRFKEEVQGPERRTELVFPEPVAEGRIPGGAIILVSVVLLSVAYGGWFYLTNQGRTVADLIPPLPGQIQTLIDSERNDSAPDAPAAVAEAPVAPAAPGDSQAKSPEPVEPAAETPTAAGQSEAPPAAARPEAASSEQPDRADTPAPEPAPSQQSAAAEPPATRLEPPPVQDAPAVQGMPPTQGAHPAQSAQIAALPTDDAPPDSADDAYSGPPLDPGPAPELEALIRDEASTTAPAPDPAPAPAQSEPEPIVQQTVVIPAPPVAPRDFARPGERTPQIYGESNEDARIVLRALQDSWVQIRDGQDALLLTRVLRSGDVYRVPDRAGLTLLTGNAGGIELEVDGVTLPPLGPIGAVRRQIALDPSALLGGGRQ